MKGLLRGLGSFGVMGIREMEDGMWELYMKDVWSMGLFNFRGRAGCFEGNAMCHIHEIRCEIHKR